MLVRTAVLTSRTRRQGLRHEGLFCALFVFFGKLAAGVALAGSNVMLEIAGFNVEVDGTDQLPPLSRSHCSLSALIDVLRASEGSLLTRLHRMRREALLLLTVSNGLRWRRRAATSGVQDAADPGWAGPGGARADLSIAALLLSHHRGKATGTDHRHDATKARQRFCLQTVCQSLSLSLSLIGPWLRVGCGLRSARGWS